jgi:hypothetical protein
MKLIFRLLILISVTFCFCSGPGRKNEASLNDSLSVDEIEGAAVIPPLTKLEPGEIYVTDDAFGPTISLTGIPLETKEITQAVQILVKDNYLILQNRRPDSLFMIFELPEMKCVSAFGRTGRGPDEFGFPRIVKTEEDSILFYIYEQVSDKVYKVAKERMIPEYYLTLPKQEQFGDKQIVFRDDRTAWYAASTSRGKNIYYFNKDSVPGEKSIADLAIPRLKGSWTTYTGDFGTNFTYGRIAYAYKYFKRLRIIDMNNMNQREIIFEAEELAKGQNDIQNLEPTNITHFWGMSPGDRHFWMAYSGRTPVDVQQANRSNNKFIFIEKYDWNGNPVKRYRLDDWGYFCVDEKNETLYLSSTAGIFSILKYDLSENEEMKTE